MVFLTNQNITDFKAIKRIDSFNFREHKYKLSNKNIKILTNIYANIHKI